MKVKKKRNRTKGHLLVENLNIITALNYDTYNTTEFHRVSDNSSGLVTLFEAKPSKSYDESYASDFRKKSAV